MKVLDIPQNEETRYKVREGRAVHKYRSLTNKDYLRKKLNIIRKEAEQELYSVKCSVHGKVDEILFFEDGTASPLDYKFAEYKDRVYNTYRTQSLLYALLIRENYQLPVSRGFLVFTRSKNHLEEVPFSGEDFAGLETILEKMKRIMMRGLFPEKTKIKSRCGDCCYRNICIR